MEKKLVRVTNAILDLEPYRVSNQKPLFLDCHAQPLKLDWNESTERPSPAVIEALQNYLLNGPLNWYPDVEAIELRSRLSEYVSLSPEAISCFGGSDMALEYIARTYLEPGAEVVLSAPTYDNFRVYAQSTGARAVMAYYDNPFEPRVETLINSIGPRTRMIYICNPNNPTGAMFTPAEIVFLLAYAERAMVVVDEAYIEFSGQSAAELVNRFSNLIVIRSFSKAFGLAGLRVGYILSDPQNLEFIHRIKVGKNLNSLAQVAALAALDDIDHMRNYVAAVNESKKIIAQHLTEVGYEFKMTPANFFLLKVDQPRLACELLEQQNIFVRDRSQMKQLDGYIRISLGTPECTERLLVALSRLAERLATGFNRNRVDIAANRLTGIKAPAAVREAVR